MVTLISRVRFLRPPIKANIPSFACGERTNVSQIYSNILKFTMFPPHFVRCFEKLGVCIGLLFQTLQRLIRRTFLPDAMRFQNSSFRNFQRTKCSLGCKMRG
jgi:hypothetical protein